jgi:hypothetical protein
MNKFILIAVMMLAPVLFGCSTSRIAVDFRATDRVSKPARASDAEIAILGRDRVEKPYAVIGVVSATRPKDQDPEVVFEKFRKLARKKGGDALMDLEVAVQTGPEFTTEDSVRYSAEIIAYDETGLVEARN